MLSVAKHDPQESGFIANSNPVGPVSFGKVLGSIQGLQQRLGDFSYADISLAESRVRSLVKQLSLMRDNLANVVQLKQSVIEINQRISDIPEENFDLVSPDSLAKHPNLHAIVQASKIIRIQRQIKDAYANADTISFTTETHELGLGALTREPAGDGTETELESRLTDFGNRQSTPANPVAMPPIEESISSGGKTAQPPLHQIFPADQAQASDMAPSFEIPPSEAEQSNGKPSDWTFDFNEPIAHSNEASPARDEFEFPAETVTEQDVNAKNLSGNSETPPSSPANVEPAMISQVSNPIKAGEPIVNEDPKSKLNGGKASEKLDVSKALVPAGCDYDQRLLDEVIKNYGDFAITPNLPAILADAKPPAPIAAHPVIETPPKSEKPIASTRNAPNIQKAGDLDRQLKKIIKDYGEYDLYPKQSGMNFRTGGIAAFAVLGLVLAALYFFKSPAPPAGGSQSRPEARPAAASSTPAVDAVKPEKHENASAPLEGADAVNVNTSPLINPKQRP